MKFNCDTVLLTEAVVNVAKSAASKSSVPAMEGIKFQIDSNVLKLTGYDLELGITTEIPVFTEDENSFEFIVNAKIVVDMARSLPEDTVDFEVDENLNIDIVSGTAKYTVKGMSTEEYTPLPMFNPETKVTVSQDILKSMIEQTIFATAANDQKPILRGELFEIKDGEFNMVASDSFRLALRTEKIDSDVDYKFVVPSKSLSAIAHLLQYDSEKQVEFSSNGKHVVFNVNNYTIFTRLLEGEFISYRGLIDFDTKTEIIVETSEFSKALSRTTFLINEKIKNYVKCSFEDDQINLDFRSVDGALADKVSANISGDRFDIGVNPKYMLDALKASECDKVIVKLSSTMKPFIITPIQGNSFTYLIMPINLR
jgi:DNA polymerase-3 subunit beta